MLSESVRKRLERLNRQPIDEVKLEQRPTQPPVKNRRRSTTSVAIQLPPLLPAAEVIEKGSGEHLQMMRGWRHELFGEVAEGLKAGTLAIGIRDGKPDIFSA